MRHVQLIAISGSIGAALFVSIGGPLTSAGPLGLLLGVIFWAFVVFCASNCLIEMTTLLPLDGGFISFAERFVDESFAMALGWNVSHMYCPTSADTDFEQYIITQWALICFELTAINVIVEYWEPLHPAILISTCLVAIGALNLFSVRFFGEAEFWISITKIFLIFGLILYTFVTMVGG
jgi:amino acid transporter